MGLENQPTISLVSLSESPYDKFIGKSVGGGTSVVRHQAVGLALLGNKVEVITNTPQAFAQNGTLFPGLPAEVDSFINVPEVIQLPFGIEAVQKSSDELFSDKEWESQAFSIARNYLAHPDRKQILPITHFYIAGRLMGFVAHEVGKPFLFFPHTLNRVVTYHMKDSALSVYSPYRDQAELWILQNADQIVVSTEAERSMIAHLYGDISKTGADVVSEFSDSNFKKEILLPPTKEPATSLYRKIRVIPPGVDHEKYNPTLNDRVSQLRVCQELGIPTDTEMVFGILASRLSKIKNVETVIDAYARVVKTTGKKIALAIFGGITDSDYAQILQKRTQELELPNVFFLGTQPAEKALAAIDTFISASPYESFQLALAEAMACGKPCIISDIPTLREVSNNTQLYFDPFNPEELSQRMLEILSRKDILLELRQRGIQTAERYSWFTHVQQLLNNIPGLPNNHSEIFSYQKPIHLSKEEQQLIVRLTQERQRETVHLEDYERREGHPYKPIAAEKRRTAIQDTILSRDYVTAIAQIENLLKKEAGNKRPHNLELLEYVDLLIKIERIKKIKTNCYEHPQRAMSYEEVILLDQFRYELDLYRTELENTQAKSRNAKRIESLQQKIQQYESITQAFESGNYQTAIDIVEVFFEEIYGVKHPPFDNISLRHFKYLDQLILLTVLKKTKSGKRHFTAKDELIHGADVSKDSIVDEFVQTLAKLNNKLPPDRRQLKESDLDWKDPYYYLWGLRNRVAKIVDELKENHYIHALDYYKEQMDWLGNRKYQYNHSVTPGPGRPPFLAAHEDIPFPKSSGFDDKLLKQRIAFLWKLQQQR